MNGRVIKPKVFIEGIEVPFYRVTVQAAISAPATAVIDIPPVEEFFERIVTDPDTGKSVKKPGLLPRTLVHVFYEDSDDPDETSKLLFEGEFVRYDYVKDRDQRMIRITCKDISNLLSSIYVRYYSDFYTPYGNIVAAFTGVGTASKPDADNLRLAIIGHGTGFNPEIMNALAGDEAGFGLGSSFRKIVDNALVKNAFFREYDSRTRISDKMVAFADRQAHFLLEAEFFSAFIQQQMSNLKQSATVWDLFTMLMGVVFYYPVSIPSAPFIQEAVSDVVPPDTKRKKKGGTFAVTSGGSLASLLFKPYTWFTAPPNFNVIFPCQYKNFSTRRDFLAEPTRLIMTAFGILESDLVKVAPSNYLFIAPEPLARKFDQEAFDSQFKSVDAFNAGSLDAKIQSVLKLKEERRKKEIGLLERGLTQAELGALRDRITAIDVEISDLEATIASLTLQINARANIRAVTKDPKLPIQVKADLWNRSVMTARDGVALASREDLKGVVFAFDYIFQTQVEAVRSGGASPLALKQYLSNVANYKLALQQYKDRTADISLVFSPQIVAGFPALVIDPHRPFSGEVDVVSHTLDANGIAETQVRLSFVRSDEAEFAELSRNVPGGIELPRWINEQYLPDKIGNQIYARLFPRNGLIPPASSILTYAPSGSQNLVAAADEIRRLYFNQKDQWRFASGFTRRNIATISQVFGILGAAELGKNGFVFSSALDERFQAAQEYAKAALQSKERANVDAAPEVATR